MDFKRILKLKQKTICWIYFDETENNKYGFLAKVNNETAGIEKCYGIFFLGKIDVKNNGLFRICISHLEGHKKVKLDCKFHSSNLDINFIIFKNKQAELLKNKGYSFRSIERETNCIKRICIPYLHSENGSKLSIHGNTTHIHPYIFHKPTKTVIAPGIPVTNSDGNIIGIHLGSSPRKRENKVLLLSNAVDELITKIHNQSVSPKITPSQALENETKWTKVNDFVNEMNDERDVNEESAESKVKGIIKQQNTKELDKEIQIKQNEKKVLPSEELVSDIKVPGMMKQPKSKALDEANEDTVQKEQTVDDKEVKRKINHPVSSVPKVKNVKRNMERSLSPDSGVEDIIDDKSPSERSPERKLFSPSKRKYPYKNFRNEAKMFTFDNVDQTFKNIRQDSFNDFQNTIKNNKPIEKEDGAVKSSNNNINMKAPEIGSVHQDKEPEPSPVFSEIPLFEKPIWERRGPRRARYYSAGSAIMTTEKNPARKRAMSLDCGEGVFVKQSYKASSEDELTIHEGDIIEDVEKSNEEGWWRGSIDGNTGLFPATNVRIRTGTRKLIDQSRALSMTTFEQTQYKITVKLKEKTKIKSFKINIIIYGDEGQTGNNVLKSCENNTLMQVEFQIKTYYLGDIERIKVWNENEEFGATWNLQYIEIENQKFKFKYFFDFENLPDVITRNNGELYLLNIPGVKNQCRQLEIKTPRTKNEAQ